MASQKRRRWPYVIGGIVAVIVVALLLFRWDWLIPIVDRQASAALGRPVSITHLQVGLGRTTRIEADGVTVGNPPDWPDQGQFAAIERLGIDVDVMAYLTGGQLVLPVIDVQSPVVEAARLADGRANWTFPGGGGGGGPGAKLGLLRIADGKIHVKDDTLGADFNVALKTQERQDGTGEIVADAKGTYAKQPINGHFVGGALLSLRDAKTPYPVDLTIENGPTHVRMAGTVTDPLAFAGTNLKLEFAGPDMSLLLPLTGIAIPKTPPYKITGQFAYADKTFTFDDFAGTVGSSDLEGDIKVDTHPKRPVLTADLKSNRVDIKDLGGFIGAQPGDAAKGTKKTADKSGKVLPDVPVSLPKLTVADVHLKYHAKTIEGGRKQPLDDMQANLDIVDGDIDLHPLSFGVGDGRIVTNAGLSQKDGILHAKSKIQFQKVDLATVLQSTSIAKGAGSIGGEAVIDGSGNSLGAILGSGNGELRLFMNRGGNVSALLVDLSGLQFGNAILSALGIPDRAQLECMGVDVVLKGGVADVKTAVLETNESRVGVKGDVNLKSEKIDLQAATDAKHFTIGSLPTPINVGGTLGAPSIAPEPGPLAARGAAAVALGIIGTPLAALLPTIQFGTGEDHACKGLLSQAKSPAKAPPKAPQEKR